MDDLPFILASEMVSMNTIGAKKRTINVGHHDHHGTQQTRRSVQLTLAATTTTTTTAKNTIDERKRAIDIGHGRHHRHHCNTSDGKKRAIDVAGTSDSSVMGAVDEKKRAKDLKDAGDIKDDVGFSAEDFKDAGFSAKNLKEAGFSALDLKDAGFDVGGTSSSSVMDTTDEKKSAWAWLRGDDSEETEDDEVELCGGQVVSVADFDMMVAAMVEKVVSQACLCACGFCGLSSSLSSGVVVISIRWHEHGLINRSGRQD